MRASLQHHHHPLLSLPTPAASRWLPVTRARLGALIMHGTTPAENLEIHDLCTRLTAQWRNLLVSGGVRPGLFKHRVQWGDMDSMGHVNNVVYARWAESGRISWAWNVGSAHALDGGERRRWEEAWTPRGTGLILRGLAVEYKFPMEFPDRVSVYHKLGAVHDDSFMLDVTILSEKHQRIAARVQEDIVLYNYQPTTPGQKPGRTQIPSFMRRVFDEVLDDQRELEIVASEEQRDIEEQTAGLEKIVMSRKEIK